MFTKGFIRPLLIGCLCAAALGLAVASSLHGPRLRHVRFNGEGTGITLAADFNVALETTAPPRVTSSPEHGFKTSLHGSTLQIVPKTPLAYDTDYTLRIEDAKDRTGKVASATIRFSTPAASFALLQREADKPDRIIRKSPGRAEEIVYENTDVADYAIGRTSTLVLNNLDKNEIASELVLLQDKKELALQPPRGVAISVDGSSQSDTYFVRATEEPHSDTRRLYIFDAPTRQFQELTESDNGLNATKILPAADGRSIVYQDGKTAVVYIDDTTDDQPAQSLGIFPRLVQVMGDDSGIVLQGRDGIFNFLDATDNSLDAIKDEGVIIDVRKLRDGSLVLLRSLARVGYATNVIQHIQDKASTTDLFSQDNRDALFVFDSMRLSPNDELVSIETAKEPAIYSGFRFNQKPAGVETLILDTHGKEVERIAGSDLQWL